MRVALLFVDGVGIGPPDASHNPLARDEYLLSQFDDGSGSPLPGGRLYTLDATFGVVGRPQSATNQTAIFTGKPAPQLLGHHVLGFPSAPLRALLAQHSIFRAMREQGTRFVFANAFPAAYLDALALSHRPSSEPALEIPLARRRRLRASASTLAMAAGGAVFATLDDLWSGRSVTHDLDGRRAKARGLWVPLRQPEESAAIVLNLMEEHDFVLFEHFLADHAGHARDWLAAQEALSNFDRFARAVVKGRRADATVIICSDHGNVEDLRTRNHTLNLVPCLVFGHKLKLPDSLSDVAAIPALIRSQLEAR